MKQLNSRPLVSYLSPLACVLLLAACSGGADTSPEQSADTEATTDILTGDQSADAEGPPAETPDAVSKEDAEAEDATAVIADTAELPDVTPTADTAPEADAPAASDASTCSAGCPRDL